jgi:hypothetical protein
VKQVVHLFQFAPAVLIEFAVTRQYMQLFEQFNGLVWFDFVNFIHVVFCCGLILSRGLDRKQACVFIVSMQCDYSVAVN